VEVSLPRTAYPPAAAADFYERVAARLAGVPGVQHVAITSGVPLSGVENLRQVTIEGRPRPDPGQEVIADYRVVTTDYFAVMGIPQLAGQPPSCLLDAATGRSQRERRVVHEAGQPDGQDHPAHHQQVPELLAGASGRDVGVELHAGPVPAQPPGHARPPAQACGCPRGLAPLRIRT
jgi:hypothetical protein